MSSSDDLSFCVPVHPDDLSVCQCVWGYRKALGMLNLRPVGNGATSSSCSSSWSYAENTETVVEKAHFFK